MISSTRHSRNRKRPRRTGGLADYALLKQEIKDLGLLARRPWHYAVRVCATLCLLLGVLWWVARVGATWQVWLGAPLLAFASGQTVLLAHDAAHHAIFAAPWANAALAWLSINVLNGGSHGWWTHSHNEHHARSNDPDTDPDIDYPFLAFSAEQLAGKQARFRPLLRRQHVLGFLVMGLSGISLRLYSAAYLVQHRERRAEALGMAVFWLCYPALIIGSLGLVRGLLFIALQQLLFGYYVGSITAVNHWGMPMPRDSHRLDFVLHQVVTSRNVAGGFWADLWFGGLNRQIEHHLFPTMARDQLALARPIVQRFCAARGIPYHEVGAAAAYREMFLTLRRVAWQVR